MKEFFQHVRKALGSESIAFFKWLVFAVIIGLVVGTVGAVFHIALEEITLFRKQHFELIFLLPVAGLAIVSCYHLAGMANDRGTEFVLASVRDARMLKLRTAPLIFLATCLTHLCGGSAGREGAALQLGGSISSYIGRKMRLDEEDERIITMAGMAAGFAALFGTPLAAAVFSMEVVSVGIMYYAAIVPCFLSAMLAQMVASRFGVEPTSFTVFNAPDFNLISMVQVILLGAMCALLANVFCRAMRGATWFYRTVVPHHNQFSRWHPWLKVAFGGVLVVILTLVCGNTDYNGAGMDVIQAALGGTVVPYAFLLKILFTVLTLAAGFKGGEIVPSFFLGATFGCAVAPLLGLSPSFGAAAGMVAVFCGVTNAPMTSVLLAYELFTGVGVAPLAVAVAVSFMLSGYSGIYHEQKIIYSKLKPSYFHDERDY